MDHVRGVAPVIVADPFSETLYAAARIGLDELASWYPVGTEICDVEPMAMISAYNAMVRAISRRHTDHLSSCPCAEP